MLAETTETFADQFDLSLLVGENNDGKFQAQYNVVLASLCLASPVFKAMHLGPFKEKDERIIRLPEDDPDGLSTLLRIMHFQFKALPKFTIDRIAKIAIMSDKYQCIEILHPWMDEIQETISASALDWAKVEDSLFAAWIFKEHDSFKKALRCIILDSKTNYRLDLMINERKVDEALLPEGMKSGFLDS